METESDYESFPASFTDKSEKFIIDTKNLCLLCFNPVLSLPNLEEELNFTDHGRDKAAFKFQFLSRFLNVNIQEILKLEPDSKDDNFIQAGGLLNKSNCQLQLTLCSKCSEVINLFFDLYQEVEVALMLINDYVRKIRDSVRKSDNDQSLLEEYQKRRKLSEESKGQSGTEDNMRQVAIVADIRESLIEKCSEYLNKSGPRVMLHRRDTPSSNTVPERERVVETASEKSRVKDDDSEDISINNSLHGLESVDGERKYNFPFIITKSYGNGKGQYNYKYFCTLCNKYVSQKTYHGRIHTQETFQCPHCPKKFRHSTGRRRHVTELHTEQPLLKMKLPNVTPKLFKVACHLLYAQEKSACSTRKCFKKENTKRKISYKCRHCSKEQTYSDMYYLWPHILEVHRGNIHEQLTELQQDKKTLVENINVVVPRRHPGRGGERPSIIISSEKVSPALDMKKEKNVSEDESEIEGLGEAFDTQESLDPLSDKRSTEMDGAYDESEEVADNGDDGDKQRSISNMVRPRKTPYKFITRKVIGQYKDSKGIWQKQYKFFCTICKIHVSNRTYHGRQHSQEKVFSCSYCPEGSTKFESSSRHSYHVYSYHLEKKFLQYKEKHVTLDQFKGYVDLLKRKCQIWIVRRKCSDYSTGVSYQCSFCKGGKGSGKSYSTDYIVKMHMIQNHRPELGKILKRFQSNPRLLEKCCDKNFLKRFLGQLREATEKSNSDVGVSNENKIDTGENKTDSLETAAAAEAILLKVELFDNHTEVKQEPKNESYFNDSMDIN